VGKPQVNFRETITQRAEFDYLHRKQSGGQGQYGRVVGYMSKLFILTLITLIVFAVQISLFHNSGMLTFSFTVLVLCLLDSYIEPLPEASEKKFEFENMMVGQAVPSQFIAAIEKGFIEASNSYVQPSLLLFLSETIHCSLGISGDRDGWFLCYYRMYQFSCLVNYSTKDMSEAMSYSSSISLLQFGLQLNWILLLKLLV